ncbi:cerebellar deproteinration-related protein 2 [Sigmodon hispidus]
MLTDNLVEEFEIEDEPRYDHRDLQQDLQLAAELGKTLLDRNTELEDSLQQMYTTNQEQFLEIEYLTKQSQVEELKSSNQGRGRQKTCDQEKPAPSFSCLKELYDLRQHFVYDHVFAEKITSLQNQQSPEEEEENEHLKKPVTMLQAQLSLERKKRVSVEAEYKVVLKENSELEQQLGATDAYRARALELEAEVAEMRQMLQAEHPFVNGVEKLVPDSLFLSRSPARACWRRCF